MRKSIFGLFILLVFSGTLTAQDALSAYKSAKKAFTKYDIAGSAGDIADLEKARAAIDIASAGTDAIPEKEYFKLWDMKGKIYNKIANLDINKKVIDETYKPTLPNAANIAFEAYKSALTLAEKKWQKVQVVDALGSVANNMSNSGRMMFQDKEYLGAFKTFEKVLEVRELLKANGNETFLAEEDKYDEHIYMTALAAYTGQDTDGSMKYFKQLYDKSYKKAAVYDGYFRALQDSDIDQALTVLAKGRELFPEDEGLLVAEINYYLQAGKLDELVDRLKIAIDKDPENVGYMSTLGNVYDNLYQREAEAGNDETSQKYFDDALKYYQMALDKNSEDKNSMYNMGALYYNKAAVKTKELIALEGDYSKAGITKYNTKKAEVFTWFDKSLPYFQSAEKLDPNDTSTLVALREIFARKDDTEKYNEFKARLETVEAGGKNDKSFF